MVKSAGICARISSDPASTRLGVERQIADCEALAERKGWPVGEVYVDNDVSAYSGQVRAAYQQMFEDLKHGLRDAEVVWDLDRLHRQPRELEAFFDLVDAVGIAENLATVTGEYDLSTPDGRLHARIKGAVDRSSSDKVGMRLRRKHAELAAAGKVAGGGPRPFGYTDDRLQVVAEEAAIIREMASRMLAGDSLRSLAVDLNSRGIRTSQGNEWTSSGVKRVLMSPRVSGRREYQGEFFTAVWPPIITPEQSDRLRRKLGSRTPKDRRAPRRYLLTGGLLRCGRCDAPMIARPDAQRRRRYVCDGGPGHAGCGRLSALAEPLEELITKAVLYRLDTPELAAALTDARAQQTELAGLHDQIADDQAMLEELAADYANRQISRSEWMAAREPIQGRIDQARRRLSRLSPTTPIDGYVGHSDLLRAAWSGLPLSRQKAIVRVLIERVIAHPPSSTETGSSRSGASDSGANRSGRLVANADRGRRRRAVPRWCGHEPLLTHRRGSVVTFQAGRVSGRRGGGSAVPPGGGPPPSQSPPPRSPSPPHPAWRTSPPPSGAPPRGRFVSAP
jgi:DNA invertase Pin-like site-specific DNA recombinase